MNQGYPYTEVATIYHTKNNTKKYTIMVAKMPKNVILGV